MAWGRKGALWMMLVAVVLWTAAPAFACLPGLRLAAQPDCCQQMTADCGGDMAMTGSCCQLAPTHNAAAMVSAYAPEHEQQLAVLSRASILSLPASPANGRQ